MNNTQSFCFLIICHQIAKWAKLKINHVMTKSISFCFFFEDEMTFDSYNLKLNDYNKQKLQVGLKLKNTIISKHFCIIYHKFQYMFILTYFKKYKLCFY